VTIKLSTILDFMHHIGAADKSNYYMINQYEELANSMKNYYSDCWKSALYSYLLSVMVQNAENKMPMNDKKF
jgi:hypothetical protein